MVVNPGDMPIAEKKFAISASQDRVWDLLGGVIFYCLPLEKIDIISESAFNAELRWQLAFAGVTLHLKGELTDSSPPNVLVCRLNANAKWGLIAQRLRVSFVLTPLGEGRTEVACNAVAEEMGRVARLIMTKQMRELGRTTLDSIQKRLELFV